MSVKACYKHASINEGYGSTCIPPGSTGTQPPGRTHRWQALRARAPFQNPTVSGARKLVHVPMGGGWTFLNLISQRSPHYGG